MTDQDRVYDILRPALEMLEGPDLYPPRWWEFSLRKRDQYIQEVLRQADLPPLTEAGRLRYYSADPQGYEDAGSAWSRRWCAALGLSYREAFSYEIHPRLKPE